jgi:hypothetical protein
MVGAPNRSVASSVFCSGALFGSILYISFGDPRPPVQPRFVKFEIELSRQYTAILPNVSPDQREQDSRVQIAIFVNKNHCCAVHDRKILAANTEVNSGLT